jgi:hypothetical protein
VGEEGGSTAARLRTEEGRAQWICARIGGTVVHGFRAKSFAEEDHPVIRVALLVSNGKSLRRLSRLEEIRGRSCDGADRLRRRRHRRQLGTKLIQTQLYGVARLDPVSYVSEIVVLFAAAVFACVMPTRRTLAVDPIMAVRAD